MPELIHVGTRDSAWHIKHPLNVSYHLEKLHLSV